MVDENRPRPHAGEGAVVAERDRPHVVIVADAGQNEVPPRGGRRRSRRARAAVFPDPFRRDGRSPVVDDDVVAGALQVAGHRKSHDAETQESDFAHGGFQFRDLNAVAYDSRKFLAGPMRARPGSRCRPSSGRLVSPATLFAAPKGREGRRQISVFFP